MLTKKFIYLIQGQSTLVKNYLNLRNRPDSDVIYMTYDEPLEGAIFFPKSTWAEGRNRLLQEAILKGDYLYYIFCDDDISFNKGGWDLFEIELLFSMPAVGVPVFPRTINTPIKGLKRQLFFKNDEQLIAFHKDVIKDKVILPYQNQFDKIHWWASCEVQQILIQNLYYPDAIQFNRIMVGNDCKTRYEDPQEGRKVFQKTVRQWLDDQFRDDFIDPEAIRTKKELTRIFVQSVKRTVKGLLFLKKKNHKLSQRKLEQLFTPESTVLRQYQERSAS